jgi:hypothetical protein
MGFVANCRLPKECSALGKLQDTALEKQRARLNSSSNGMVTDATIQGTADAQANISKEVPDTKHGLVEACLQKPPNQQTVGDAVIITMNPA